MSILITGANGLIGRDLVNKLSTKYKIFGIYRKRNTQLKKIKNVKWIKHDLKKKISLKIQPKPKYIIHCAATHEFSKKKTTNDYFDSNVESLQNTIDFARKNKVKLIINLSTITVYGDVKKSVLTEDYSPKNPNILGITKLISEDLLYKQKINFINIRLPGVLCRSFKENTSRPWLNKIFYNIRKNKKINVYNFNSDFNNVIDTEELAKFVKFLIKKEIVIRDTFNFATTKPIRLKNIIENIKRKLNSSSEVVNSISKKKSFVISIDKLIKKLNYKTISTEDIIQNNLKRFILSF